MKPDTNSNHLTTLLGSYDGNIWEPDSVLPYMQSLDARQKGDLRAELEYILEKEERTLSALRHTISDDFRDGKAAVAFMQAFKAYIFESGSEPEVSEYLL